jgi:hypothetical protein
MAISLPVTSVNQFVAQGNAVVAGSNFQIGGRTDSTSTTQFLMYALNASGTYTTRTEFSAGVPATWANTNFFTITGSYEIS